MTYKLIDTREKRTMTEKQGEAIMKAYERYDSSATTVKVPQKEHLDRSFRPGVCCDHTWVKMDVSDEEGKKNLQKIFEETDIGDYQTICPKCKTLALWERGEIFAMDAIALAPQPPEKPERKPRKERRS